MPVMRGQLSDTSVPDLCRGLSDAHATGALEIEGEAGVARIFFRSGFVYWAMSPAPRAQLGSRLVNAGFVTSAQLEDALERQQQSDVRTKLGALLVDEGLVTQDVIRVFVQEQILDALFDTMRWNEGGYSFHSGDAVAEKLPVDIPVAELLVAVARRLGEWDQVQRVIADLDAVPDHVTGKGGMSTSLEPDEFAVLASIDGIRSVSELAADLGYSEFEAARIIYGLTLLGVVEIDEGEDDEEASDALEQAAAAASEADEADAADEDTGLEIDLEVDDLDPDAEDAETAAYEVPAPDQADDEAFDVGAALEAALTEPPSSFDASKNADRDEEPEPWVAGDVDAETVSSHAPRDDSATSVEAEDDQWDDLVAGFDEADAGRGEPDAGQGDDTAEDADSLGDDFDDLFAEVDDVEAGSPDEEPTGDEAPRSAAQVSELLRELSRLTLDDNDDGGSAPTEPPPARRRPRPEPNEPDDGGKKRRLFGWGG